MVCLLVFSRWRIAVHSKKTTKKKNKNLAKTKKDYIQSQLTKNTQVLFSGLLGFISSCCFRHL